MFFVTLSLSLSLFFASPGTTYFSSPSLSFLFILLSPLRASLPLLLPCFPLSSFNQLSIFRSTAAQHSSSSFILTEDAGTPGYILPLYLYFFCPLRYGASINNGSAYSVAAVSTQVVFIGRSLLLCCTATATRRKTSFWSSLYGKLWLAGSSTTLLNITRGYASRALKETLETSIHYRVL